ncbi:MAG: nucleotidyltransferase domain-containing protein [Kiritimatiellae bacterium]|nr:nucleotidyltransferase domain-containing protein [Kiritimatiellia bacterium]
MRLLLDNLPSSLRDRKDVFSRCFAAFGRCRRIHEILLFGSHARGEASADSDVDLCIIADDAEQQLRAARDFRRAIRWIRPKPPLTLLPITPQRLDEKKQRNDHFFATVLQEGICLAKED